MLDLPGIRILQGSGSSKDQDPPRAGMVDDTGVSQYVYLRGSLHSPGVA